MVRMSSDTAAATESGDDFKEENNSNKHQGDSEKADAVVVQKTIKDKRETLQKKPSSADLQSRLKSRKLLGVGATDDGMDIHRSKVSQILGHNENMLTANKQPIQLLLKWNCFLSALLLFSGTWSLLLPRHYSQVVLGTEQLVGVYYSVSLLCFALPLFAMSQAFTEHDSQLLTLTAMEIMLATHCIGACGGGAVTAGLTLMSLLAGNTIFLTILYTDAPNKFAGLYRKFSQSREDDFHLSASDKKYN